MDEKQVSKQNKKTYDWLKPTQFKPGQSGNPNGRPKGPTLKTWLKEHFLTLTDEERAEFLNKVDPIKAWEMAEGKAQTNIDHTSKGEKLPTPLLANVQADNSTEEDTEPEEKD